MDWIARVKVQFKRNQSLMYGLPFMCVVLLGPFVLRQFNEVRYKYRQVSRGSAEELEEMGVKMNKSNDEISLESEYQKVKDNLDIENWEQVRGPRPWEEEPPPEKK